MSVDELCRVGASLWGAAAWQTRMAEALAVNPSTVRRWVSGAIPIPGPVVVALRCLKAKRDDS